MLHTSSLTASAVLWPSQLEETLSNMLSTKWKPALVESRWALVNLAGVADKVQLPSRLDGLDNFGRLNAIGDVYFLEGDVYFSLFSFESFAFFRMSMNDERSEGAIGIDVEIEVGIISQNVQGLDDRLKEFSKQFSNALPEKTAGRRTDIRWKRPEAARVSRKENADEGEGYRFSQPTYGKSEIEASRVLSCSENRRMLIDISQAGFARIRDITSAAKQDTGRVESSLNELKSSGLLKSEYSIDCKQKNVPLTRINSLAELNSSSIGDLPCPHCGRSFKDEVTLEVVAPSDLARRLISKSTWMTVWVTDVLEKLGIRRRDILWNVTEMSEEVDILLHQFGEVWIFELKDREFSSGDAYPFNYRIVKHHANKGIVVTTERVAADAKRVFEDMAREARRSVGEQRGSVVFIEGLDNLENALHEQLKSSALRRALRALSPLERYSGFELAPIVTAYLGEAPTRTTRSIVDPYEYYRDDL